MTRTFRHPLRPTARQAAEMSRWLGVCCDLYNAALQERRDAWRVARKRLSMFDQQRQLKDVRAADPAVAAVPFDLASSALRRVELAFGAFFRRCKSGQAPGYPRFRSRRRYGSFSFFFPNGGAWVEGGHIRIPKLGHVRFIKSRDFQGVTRGRAPRTRR